MKKTIILFYFISFFSNAQSDFDKILKGGEILVNGLSFLKSNNSETKQTNSKIIESVCIKNKLADKITYIMVGKDEEGNAVKKELVKDAFLYAQKNNVLLIAGSGNNSRDNDIKPFYPIDYDEKTGVEFCDNFIKVGAVTLDGDKYFLAYFTNYGKKTVDVFAPGYFLKTTDPIMGYSYRDGTSISGPVVSGVAALVRSYYPKLKASEVKHIILESGISFDNLQVLLPDNKEGIFKPFKELSKTGKVVNAYNALLMAKEMSKNKIIKK